MNFCFTFAENKLLKKFSHEKINDSDIFVFNALCNRENTALFRRATSDLIGSWKYEVAGAPTGYDKGTLVFAEKDGKLAGEVKFADGYKIDLKDVSFESGVLKSGVI